MSRRLRATVLTLVAALGLVAGGLVGPAASARASAPTGCTAGAPALPWHSFTLGPDMTGDGRGETIVVDAVGALWLLPGQADGGVGTACRLGSGFSDIQVFAPGDIDGDGRADILGITPDGNLWLYPGNGAATQRGMTQVGSGWTGWRLIPSGDLTGDGKPDLLGIDGRGTLYLYAGKGNGRFATRVAVGSGWTGWQLYAAGDLNGDGKADILGIDSRGVLYQYTGKGNGRFNPRQVAGKGWSGYLLAAGADLTGDGLADIVGGNRSTGDLFFYRGVGNAQFAARVQIGWGTLKPPVVNPPVVSRCGTGGLTESHPGHWIEVDLSEQRTCLHDGGTVVASFLVSTGRPGHETPTGTFSVLNKYPLLDYSSNKPGDTYYLPNVHWNTRFYAGYLFHEAYWHNMFGHVESHGCVNMRLADAKALYDFVKIGDLVIVHQ